jgi:hypothetical protein
LTPWCFSYYEKHLHSILLCVNEASVHKNKTTDLKATPTRYYKDQTKTDEQVSQIASRMKYKLFEMSRMSGRDGIDDAFGCVRRPASGE